MKQVLNGLRMLQSTVMLVCSVGAVAAGADTIPAEIKAPAGEKLVLKAHATGSQIYTCKAAPADGTYQWTLKAPDAQLLDKKGAVIGRHYAGPTWKYKDGSEITGKASAHVDSPDPSSIPWLLVAVTGHTGEGTFAKVSSVQRINTQGGKPPSEPCSAAAAGTESSSSYSADYLFYAPSAR